MKKIIFLAFLTIGFVVNAQISIDLSDMQSDVVLGQNCSASQEPVLYVATGDVNLQGSVVYLRNARLMVPGDVNGYGDIVGCGNSSMCYTGMLNNIPLIEGVIVSNCVLDVPGDLFVPEINNCRVYDISSRLIYVGLNDSNMYDYLPFNQIFIVKIDGQPDKKIMKRW